MTLRYLTGASAVALLTCGLTAVAPAYAQNDVLLPPEESAVITVTGCLQLGGDKRDMYVLTTPRLGPVASVTNGACDAPIDARAVRIKDADKRGINETLAGHWIEISGRLEKEESSNPDNLRELYVRSFRLVPVVPQRVEAAPAPLPSPQAPAPAAAPAPVATTGVLVVEEPLPKTASPLAMIGLFGLLSLASGVGFRIYRSRVRA